MLSPTLENLIKIFAKFPTIGPKTAARFVFYLLNSPAQKSDELIKAIGDLKTKIKICPWCFRAFENESSELCSICENPKREKTQICLVEKEIDLETIEKTNSFLGLYFILGGVLPFLKKETAEQALNERLNVLINRINQSEIKEIILAVNPTPEGQNTILWLQRKLGECNIKISQLAKGMPLGGEIEYADEETIASALQNRR